MIKVYRRASSKIKPFFEARGAQGIEAEIPQDRHRAGRGIGANSPVFASQKCARMITGFILEPAQKCTEGKGN
jgi:hypothetical protein